MRLEQKLEVLKQSSRYKKIREKKKTTMARKIKKRQKKH